MNFTRSGIHYNNENIMIARQEEAVALFQTEFESLWATGSDLKPLLV